MYLPEGCTRPDAAALDAFWSAARAAVPSLADASGYQVRWIGHDEGSTERIFRVIRSREKVGTFTLPWIVEATGQPAPAVGDCLVLLDYAGRPTLLVRLTGIRDAVWGRVTAEDVAVDGPAVRDLATWIPLHTRYWTALLAPFGRAITDDMPFWVERFELLYDAAG